VARHEGPGNHPPRVGSKHRRGPGEDEAVRQWAHRRAATTACCSVAQGVVLEPELLSLPVVATK